MSADAQPRRLYFDSFEEAARDFHLPLENMKLARAVASSVPHGKVYIPTQSRAYIALVDPDGSRMAVAIHSGYAWGRAVTPPSLADIVEQGNGWWAVVFPTNSLRLGGNQRGAGRERIAPPLCDVCSITLPASGRCDTCDD